MDSLQCCLKSVSGARNLDDANGRHAVSLPNRLNMRITACNLPEDRVIPVQVCRRLAIVHDEKLGTARIAPGVRHGERSALVDVRVIFHLTLDSVARSACSGAIGAAALSDEARNDAVKGQTVVKA